MATNRKWTKSLKKGIITSEMHGAATYSVSKRAKNCRDKATEYRYGKYASKYRDKRDEYYGMKDDLLSIVSPVAVHHVTYDSGSSKNFWYYDIGGYGFHRPISPGEKIPNGLPVINIDNLYVPGKDFHELESVQFVRKLLKLIESGQYAYVP